MANKDYCEAGMKMGTGMGKKPPKAASGKVQSDPVPKKTANWPGVPGKTQGKSRSGGTATAGKLGPFYVKKVGL